MDEEGLAKVLGLDSSFRIAANNPVGYPPQAEIDL
jgi:hypothetical protein